MRGTIIIGVIVASSFAGPALADWWIVRSSDQKCLVVDVEPTGKGVTKIGKNSYRTAEEAEADAKKFCEEPTLKPRPHIEE
jgi:hypothetical protein